MNIINFNHLVGTLEGAHKADRFGWYRWFSGPPQDEKVEVNGHECGTTACVGGWVSLIMSGEVFDRNAKAWIIEHYGGDFVKATADYLDISFEEAFFICIPSFEMEYEGNKPISHILISMGYDSDCLYSKPEYQMDGGYTEAMHRLMIVKDRHSQS